MAREFNPMFLVIIILGIMQVQTLLVVDEPQVPCYFIFGDSLVDNGNNNRLKTTVKTNYPPYGIDFPQGVTGRFTNGRTSADIIGKFLGFEKFIPSYATATNQEINNGVNYASGGSGIREETGSNLGDRISLDRQLLNHKKIISRLSILQSNNTFTNEYLKKCIYLANIGSNDYINNYLLPNNYPTSKMYTVDQYATVLVQQYSRQLKTLYELGARKVVVFGLAPIGCAPIEIIRFGTNGITCVEWINDAVQLFNDRLKPLVDELNVAYSDARFTFINLRSILAALISASAPCCQLRADGFCVPNSIPCPIRALSLFYDGLHPTEIANTIVATRSYVAVSPVDASPYDISHLARI